MERERGREMEREGVGKGKDRGGRGRDCGREIANNEALCTLQFTQ